MSRRQGRRAFMRALGVGAAALPWVPILPSWTRAGAEDEPPRRVVFVHFAHGVARDRWSPQVGPEGLVLSPILAPLEPFASRLTVVEGLDNAPGMQQVGDPHNIAVGSLLTAMPLRADLGPGGHYLPGGISIDQRLAPELSTGAMPPPWPSLNLGVRTQGFAISALDADRPLRAEDDPTLAHARLFGELGLSPASRQHLQAQRARARDLVRTRLDALASTLPSADREVLDAHAESLEALQDRVEATRPAACEVPEPPPAIEHAATPADADVPALVRAQTGVLVAALACDLTRVATLQWGSSANDGLRHVWQDIGQEFHSLAHLANGDDPHAHEHLAAMNTWTMAQLGELLAGLEAVPQGEGTLLDHTLVVCLSGLSVAHHMGDLPVVLAGGGLAGGRVLEARGAPLSSLWLALAQHLVVGLGSFGDPAFDVGPLAGLG